MGTSTSGTSQYLPEGLFQPPEPACTATCEAGSTGQRTSAHRSKPRAALNQMPLLPQPPVETPRPDFYTGCQNFSSRTEPQLSTVVTCWIMHHLLAAVPPYIASLHSPEGFAPPAKEMLAHGSLLQGMLAREPKLRHHISHFLLLFCIILKCGQNYTLHFA